MRIGVGFDDTICRTTEIVHDRVEKYALSERLNALDIMNDEFLKEGFFSIYLEDIYANAEIKREVKGVLKRLRSRGNEIYIITSRNNDFVSTVFYFFAYFVHFFIMIIVTSHFTEIVDWDSGDVSTAPGCDFTVTMFADDKGMYTSAVDAK